ncbi:MAG: sigma 54-interacting transcriptional regulator [Thermodesulfobacteriota bacterium]
MMDYDFNQVKLRLSSKGDIGETLCAYYECLHEFLPVDQISLAKFDFDQKYMRIFAQVSETGSEMTNFSYEVPEQLLDLMKQGKLPEIYVINEPDTDPIGRAIIDFEGVSDWSLIFLPIKEHHVVSGAILFVANSRKKFAENHSFLLKDLYDEHKWLLEIAVQKYGITFSGYREYEPVEDEHDFFRQVTRRLCGHLDLETGALHCLQYISRFLPATSLMAGQLSQDMQADVTVVKWSGLFHYGDITIPWNLEKANLMEMMALPRVIITHQPEKDPLLSDYVERFGADWSAISMALYRDGMPFGFASISIEGRNQYNETHMALFSMLHDPFALALSNNIKHREIIHLKNAIEAEKKVLQEELHDFRGDTIIGKNSGLRGVMENARLVAGQDSPVLLSGETGTGKEMVANFIHQHSSRRDGPFIKVNCGAIPDTLVDSELFGHEKGAFTGADSRKLGRFERADRGTIFLDEIGELPLAAQVRLLRVLQHKIIERVGGTESIPVNIRVIAATNRNLEEMVASGRFREDLWFRLNVFPVQIPPLRSRKMDIPALLDHFIEKKSVELNLSQRPSLSPGALKILTAYNWPGNVRELENVVERELILSKGETLTFQNIDFHLSKVNAPDNGLPENENLEMDKVYIRHITNVLALTSGKINGPGGAAELLKVKPSTLRHRMDKLGIVYGWEKRK